MASNFSATDLSSDGDFGFAFNDRKFSDKILRIEIVSGPIDGDFGSGEVCASMADWACNRKRRREEMKKEIAAAGDLLQHEEQILNCRMPDDGLAYENQDGEAVAMVEGSPSGVGDEDDEDDDPTWSKDGSEAITIKTIHISSPILAAKSPFFFKLFSNGMKETGQQHVSLRIHASEEAALMELLSFMYCGTLSTTTRPALLNMLMAADKFEVASCMRYCCRLLCNLPMTCQSALLYLDLLSNVSMGEAVQTLTNAAKQYLAMRYKDLPKFQDEVLDLPLAGLEAVISSDDLQVASEDAIYDFVLKWARMHYPKLEDRKEVLGSHLARLIRFPFMTCRKLKKALTCIDLDSELASKLVLDSLFFKAEAPHRQQALAAEESTHRRFVERAYRYRPVKVVEFELPRQHCIVYLDLKRGECAQMFPSGRVYSQAFHLGGQGFFLSAHCNTDQQSLSPSQCFGLFLGMQEKGSVSFSVDYEFASRSAPDDEFTSRYKGNYTFTGGKAVGYRNLCGLPWSAFIMEDIPHFINGVLHLRAELTIRR